MSLAANQGGANLFKLDFGFGSNAKIGGKNEVKIHKRAFAYTLVAALLKEHDPRGSQNGS